MQTYNKLVNSAKKKYSKNKKNNVYAKICWYFWNINFHKCRFIYLHSSTMICTQLMYFTTEMASIYVSTCGKFGKDHLDELSKLLLWSELLTIGKQNVKICWHLTTLLLRHGPGANGWYFFFHPTDNYVNIVMEIYYQFHNEA